MVTPIMIGSVYCATLTSCTRWVQCHGVGLGMDQGWLVGLDRAYWEWTCVGHRHISGDRASRTPSACAFHMKIQKMQKFMASTPNLYTAPKEHLPYSEHILQHV